MAGKGLNYVIETAREVWNIEPHRDVRIPPALQDSQPVAVNALWTDYGLRPSATNLAFMVQSVAPSDLEQWKRRLRDWPIRAGLLISDGEYLLEYIDPSGRLKERLVEPDSLAIELAAPSSYLFTPKALAEFRSGQLTLADLEESVSKNSLSFLLRQRAELDKAFQDAIKGTLAEIGIQDKLTYPQNSISSRGEIAGHAIRVAIAFLAARILEDKGFFGTDSNIPTDDPRALLYRTVPRANGFFKKALEDSIPYLNDRILQHLAANLGSRVSFALVDHKDVGLLYERAIKELPNDIEGEKWSDLQRHYTPVAIAERMLELLPLERLRPEERVIFDPAAGSGSLLLAATSRLAGMSDIPEDIKERRLYLAQHVAGNDLDQYADLVTQLRYTLARESLGKDVPFPFPSHFSHKDYEKLTRENIGIKPRVIVANPPFAEDGNTQRSAKFIETVLGWLEKDTQFAFILPQSFLTASSHGIANARKLLAEYCHIFEVWQCPAGNVGIDANQDVCVVLGSVGKPQIILPTAARAIFSQMKSPDTRDNGFLGKTWIAQLNSDSDNNNWASITAPPINITVPTISLGKLFFVFNGVTPSKHYKPVSECPPNTMCKLNWRMKWRDKKRLWADPKRVPEQERWLRYGREYLESSRLENAQLLDLPKIFIGRKVNRGSVYPLAAQLDNIGLCPDNNIFCVLPAQEAGKYVQGYENDRFPKGWEQLDYKQQILWLLGILTSRICNALSLIGRKTHEITLDELCKIQLPQTIDLRIIKITEQIILRDQNYLPITQPDEMREQLDKLVEESYGNPSWMEIARTGIPPELEDWKSERTKSTFTVRGQVLEISEDNSQIRLYLNGLMDDNREEWLPILPEIPGWALDGTVFEAELSEDVETFAELAQRPWAIRRFRHTPRPYLTDEELTEELGIET
ncbi:N-6 DNA methylase [Nostoc sp. 'Peltigera membranacea cyanobiont' N6]|uniref:N-6 DNA methylase n=1 Tax=Nostoc sp. 'Peltigera membranacea cyanobiont' N6 TaxID=1261031 RepID=UPI000CF34353|nr:N-6 DNA methylase [Nostoc sp. 'Peltigera membranacea cyanobiont' N6]AVH65713.1 type I restriction-modification system methyltransferase subunit [Nostoc sp. 'Peltigera membranacea cyanobiont' N6]